MRLDRQPGLVPATEHWQLPLTFPDLDFLIFKVSKHSCSSVFL